MKIVLHETSFLLGRSSTGASIPSYDGEDVEAGVVLEKEGSRERVDGLEGDVACWGAEEGDSG